MRQLFRRGNQGQLFPQNRPIAAYRGASGFVFNQRTYVRLGMAARLDVCFFCRIQK